MSDAETIHATRTTLRRRLGDAADADLLLCHALGCDHTRLYAHPEAPLSSPVRKCIEDLVRQRLAGTPMAYLLGACEFFSLEFEITPWALIPRPETETLVETTLALTPKRANVLELGTGCGAIAIAIAANRPDVNVIACDCSRDALALARRNARRHDANVTFIESDWFAALPKDGSARFDVVVGNPPYVADDDPDLDPEVKAHEPHAALFAGADGFACLNRIIGTAPTHLSERGAIALEHGHTQGEGVARMMTAAGFGDVHCIPDLAGRPRVTTAKLTRGSQERGSSPNPTL